MGARRQSIINFSFSDELNILTTEHSKQVGRSQEILQMLSKGQINILNIFPKIGEDFQR